MLLISMEMGLCITKPAPHSGMTAGKFLDQDPLIQAYGPTAGQTRRDVFELQPRLWAEHQIETWNSTHIDPF